MDTFDNIALLGFYLLVFVSIIGLISVILYFTDDDFRREIKDDWNRTYK